MTCSKWEHKKTKQKTERIVIVKSETLWVDYIVHRPTNSETKKVHAKKT